MNTRFRVHAILKGKLKAKQLTVLHFADEAWVVNGPMSADFGFSRTYKEQLFRDRKASGWGRLGRNPEKPIWLAFLKTRHDARFEPVTGQYDSALSSCELIDLPGHRTPD